MCAGMEWGDMEVSVHVCNCARNMSACTACHQLPSMHMCELGVGSAFVLCSLWRLSRCWLAVCVCWIQSTGECWGLCAEGTGPDVAGGPLKGLIFSSISCLIPHKVIISFMIWLSFHPSLQLGGHLYLPQHAAGSPGG